MTRWLLVIGIALLLINWLPPFLGKFGIGRLPGDFRFSFFGKEFFLPIGSTVALSVIAAVIAKLI